MINGWTMMHQFKMNCPLVRMLVAEEDELQRLFQMAINEGFKSASKTLTEIEAASLATTFLVEPPPPKKRGRPRIHPIDPERVIKHRKYKCPHCDAVFDGSKARREHYIGAHS